MTAHTDTAAVLSAWPIGAVRSIEPLDKGSNNDNWLVETLEGDYVLRVHRNANVEAGIAFEMMFLDPAQSDRAIFERSVERTEAAWPTLVASLFPLS